ncbi:MAG TPA: DUF1778 domain-containing protein [Bdellovibrionota bacterium]|nr:DUF1778 domain-containing protein [Bdellovibrionota bacterium]
MSRSATHRNEDRIDIRTRPEVKKTLQKAADLLGSDLSKFILASSVERARKILAEQEIIRLSNRDRDLFLKTLEAPPAPSPALQKTFERYKKTIG